MVSEGCKISGRSSGTLPCTLECGNNVPPPASTSDKYINIVTIRLVPCKLKKFDVKLKKSRIDNSVIVCGKSEQNMYNVKKKTCLGVLDRGERGDTNETSLKEGGGIEISTTVLPYTRCTLSSL